jgi:hypothetical protein
MTGKKVIFTALKVVIVAVVLFFIVRTLLGDWETVRSFDWEIDLRGLLMSLPAFIGAYAFLALAWWRVLHALGFEVSYMTAWDIYFIGNLGRYIPGKVWAIAGVAWMGGRAGMSKTATGTAAVYAQAYSILAAFVFSAVLFILSSESGVGLPDWLPLWPMVGAVIVLVAVFVIPGNLERVLNMLLRRVGKQELKFGLTFRDAATLIIWYLMSWVVFGAAMHLFIEAVTGESPFTILYLAGVYAVAGTVGFLAFFVPGGIGIREGVIVLLLGTSLPNGVAVVIAAAVRMIVTIVELLCAGSIVMRKGFIHHGETKTEVESGGNQD